MISNRIRLGGMNTGLDTEAIVKAMGSSTMLRINNNKRRVLQLQAQQAAYREVIGKLSNFQEKFFRIGRENFLRGTTNFSRTSAKVFMGNDQRTPVGVSVVSNNAATAATYNVKLISNASAARVTGAALSVSNGGVDMNALTTGEQAISVQVGSVTHHLTVNTTAEDTAGNTDRINAALREAFGSSNPTTEFPTGRGIVRIDSSGNITSDNLQTIRVSNPVATTDTIANPIDITNVDEGTNSFRVQIGNQQRTVSFNAVAIPEIPAAELDSDGVTVLNEAEIDAARDAVDAAHATNADRFAEALANAGLEIDGTQIKASNGNNVANVTNSTMTTSSVSTSTTMAALGVVDGSIFINGQEISVDSDWTVNQFVSAVNSSPANVTISFNSLSGSFNMTSKNSGADASITIGGNSAITDRLGLTGAGSSNVDGRNMTIEINGHQVETASNSHTVDGTTFTFAAHAAAGTEFRVEVGRDTAQLANIIKNFVEDYNQMIREVFGKLNERPDRNYHFLTDFDMEEFGLSDRQIVQWEDRAKLGLLSRNSAINGVMSRMRMAMLTSVTTADGGSFSIFNINGTGGTAAIRPAADHRRNGELEFDEEALIQALESNPDEIMQLFTAPDGLMAKMEAEIDRAISTRVGREGILVARAGTETGRLSIRNTMLDRINNLNRIIDTLQARYDRQQDRFWNVFSNMEKQFGSLNSQQDFIAGMFGNMF